MDNDDGYWGSHVNDHCKRIAMILPPRADDSIYTGTLTYTASKKVDIFVIHTFGISNSSLVNSTYDEPANFPVGPGIQVAIRL